MGSIGQLDQAQEHMKREGWCVVPDVLTPQETKEVLDELWSVAAQANKRGEDTFLPFLDPNESNVRFAAEGENQAGKSDTAAAFAKSSHNN
ncbi:hypothetical protein Slin15195_G053790 [Septoria linicola]|uniref:Uncharacterized protein n=1 Tax=Septoria linicola TaxID=215465 RepID=A0A9Q9AT41_9PEZI|nr:hypothetical protein Slin15195_G053790 [Septoria linicola]